LLLISNNQQNRYAEESLKGRIGYLSGVRVYFSVEAILYVIFSDVEIIIHLQAQPKLRRIAEKSS